MSADKSLSDPLDEGGKECRACEAKHHEHSKKSGAASDRKVNRMIYILIGILVVFALVVYINDKTGFINNKTYDYYKYSNGESEFDVMKVQFQKYEGWQIKLFLPDDETPYVLDVLYDPLSIEDVPIDRSIRAKVLAAERAWITWDPGKNLSVDTTMAGLELIKILPNQKLFFKMPVNTSFTAPYLERPVRSCANATEAESVLYFRLADETSVTSDGSCIILNGRTETDLIRAADRLMLYLLGIMQ